jgi:hypothetical protein
MNASLISWFSVVVISMFPLLVSLRFLIFMPMSWTFTVCCIFLSSSAYVTGLSPAFLLITIFSLFRLTLFHCSTPSVSCSGALVARFLDPVYITMSTSSSWYLHVLDELSQVDHWRTWAFQISQFADTLKLLQHIHQGLVCFLLTAFPVIDARDEGVPLDLLPESPAFRGDRTLVT